MQCVYFSIHTDQRRKDANEVVLATVEGNTMKYCIYQVMF